MMNTIRKTILAIVLVLMGSVNLWATDYLFGYDKSNTKYYLGIPANPGSSGNCEAIIVLKTDTPADSSAYQRCIWHCVNGTGSSASSVNISSSTGYYLYATIPGSETKYWLRVASSNGETIRYTTTASEASSVQFNSTGLLVNSSYYAYINGTNICTSSSSGSYNKKLLTIGSFSRVIASPKGYGKVFVRGDTPYPTPSDDFVKFDTDQEAKCGGKNGTKYYLYAQPSAGYYFKGWSKTNSYSVDIAATNMSGRNENLLEFNETNGYYALYYAMYVPYWKFSATGSATSAGHGTVSVNLTKSEVVATDNSSTTGTTTATFTATPESGYDFAGWTDSPSGTTVTQGTDNPKTVTITNSEPGSTATVTLYAIFKPYTYSIVISAAGTKNGESIVFNVSGPVNYRISVPVGESVTIKDVKVGNYTVTPETAWSKTSTISPSSENISFTSSSGSQSKTAAFSVTPKASQKHSETSSVVKP